MVSYGTHQANYGKNYAFVSYGTSTNYSVTSNNWRKTTCCGQRRFGQPCSDCAA